MKKIKVLIADDQTLMRDGLKTILELSGTVEVTGTAEDGAQAAELCGALTPDVVLMDVRMPNVNGVEATRLIKAKHRETAVLILTTFDDDEYIVEALTAGAAGYILKDIDSAALVKAIEDAYNGCFILPSKIAGKLARRLSKSQPQAGDATHGKSEVDVLPELSGRERDVARMLAQGFTNRQISSALYLSEGTVKNHVSSIYAKIGISDRTSAALYLKKIYHSIQ
jgi:DNA-binding NarL/FixJ family response regulator